MTYTLEDRWLDGLEAFQVAQRGKGAQSATIARRVKHIRRFAVTVGESSPWHVTAEDVLAWLERLEVADSTRRSMRDSLRAFYRWAKASGRMVDDPTEAVSHRALRLPVPEMWQQPLTAYERHQWATGASPATVRARMDALRTFARENASLDPFAVTVDDLYEWMAGKRWARETRRARKVTVRSFYQWALDTGRIEQDPTDRLPVVKASDPVARPATDAEYSEALGHAGPRWGLALRLAAELGLRRGEVARVHTSDVTAADDGQEWLTVHGKGGKLRKVPLTADLASTVRVLKQLGQGYVFPGRIVERTHDGKQGHISAKHMGKRISQLLPPGVTMHALRHRFATRAYNVNRDVFTVQRLLGHASAATTQRYVQVSDERMRALVEAVSGR